MKTARITLTANAGIIVETYGKCVLVDALHHGDKKRFGGVGDSELDAIWRSFDSREPDMHLTTHCHPDHYSEQLVEEAKGRWPGCVFAPVKEESFWELKGGGIGVRALKTPHDGKHMGEEPNWAMLVSIDSFRLLVSGDCSTRAPEYLLELLDGESADAAVMSFPWLTLRRGRYALEDLIKPANTVIVHLPPEELDTDAYRAATFAAAEKTHLHGVRILAEPLERAMIEYEG